MYATGRLHRIVAVAVSFEVLGGASGRLVFIKTGRMRANFDRWIATTLVLSATPRHPIKGERTFMLPAISLFMQMKVMTTVLNALLYRALVTGWFQGQNFA